MKIDIPDITVVIVPDHEYTTEITPSEVYQVDVNVGDIYSVNLQQPDIIVTNGSSSVYEMAQLAGYAFYAGTSSFALTASYVEGDAGITDWDEITNKPSGIVSSSQQAVSWSVATASYAANVVLGLNQLSGSVFSASNFTFPQNLTVGGTLSAQQLFVSSSVIYQSGSTKFGDSPDDNHQFTGSVLVRGPISASSITGSFKGDGSQLTGLVTDLRLSGSAGSDTVSLLTDTLSVVGGNNITTTVTDNQITISPVGLATTASNTFVGNQVFNGSVDVLGDIWVTPGVINELTSSYAIKAENIGVINAGTYQTGSDDPVAPLLGITRITSASYALTASYALNGGGGGGLTSSLLSIDQYYFIGDGLTTNFTVAKPYNDQSVIVSVGGVTFISPNDYTIAGSTISFYEAPYSGSNIFVRGFVNVTTNVTGSFSGSFVGVATNAITASYISDIVLANTAPLIPQIGSVYFSGSYLYVYDGSQYKSASLN